MSKSTVYTIGFDVSDETAAIAVLDEAGKVCSERTIPLTVDVVYSTFAAFPPSRVVMEAGGQTRWLARVIGSLDQEVLIANPRTIPLLTKNNRKSDRTDALLLARLGRVDPGLLSPVVLRSEAAQEDLMELRARDHLVGQRTSTIAFVRSQAKQFGTRLGKCDADVFDRKAVEWLPALLLDRLQPMIDQVRLLTEQIKSYERRMQQMLERYPAAAALERQINGVGPITALTFVLTIDDPHRFSHSRSVGAYAGLAPKRDQSGESDPQLRISKAGNALMRRLLVQCAQYILGPFGKDSDLRRFGLRLAGAGSRRQKRRAVVAVARKLAVLMHALWISGEFYEPLRNSLKEVAV